MKKLFLSLSVLASMLVTGCSSDDAEGIGGSENEPSTHYMTVNIVTTGSSATRTEVYEDGYENENKVNNVRFYFFTENGAAANVKLSGASYQNFYDLDTDSIHQVKSSDGTNHIESLVKATIILNTKKGDQLPRSMVAILNPKSDFLPNSSVGLSALRGISYDYAKTDLTQDGTFVMANSVYAEGDPKKEVCPVYITNDNIRKSIDEAKAHPVTVYVERNVAKVKVSLGDKFTDNKLELKDKDGKNITIGGETAKQVCLKLNGWSLTAETDKDYLVKKIDPNWISDWWNVGYKRCTWAENAADADIRYVRNYNNINLNFETDSLYTNENAAPSSVVGSPDKQIHTKIVVSGTLCDNNDNALTLVKHLDILFADTYASDGTDNFPELRKSILSSMSQTYWKRDGDNRIEIEPSDIEIVANDLWKYEKSDHNCYVHAKLTTTAEGTTWYTSDKDDEATVVPIADINKALSNSEETGKIEVWREGQTYYYMEIIHLNDNPGVVRNHVYKARITNIAGLGTPVYDPSQVIYPEKPTEDDHYIAAEINILSWRVISDDYQLYW